MTITTQTKMMALLSLVLAMSAVRALYPESRVTIASVIDGGTITAHCFSADNDLGTHELGYLESYSWTFRYSLVGNTEFYCTFTTQYGSGNYAVYDNEIMDNRCGLNCLWQVQSGGPCLQQSQGPLWCQPWKNHSSKLAAEQVNATSQLK